MVEYRAYGRVFKGKDIGEISDALLAFEQTEEFQKETEMMARLGF